MKRKTKPHSKAHRNNSAQPATLPSVRPLQRIPCHPENLAPYNSYGVPRFVAQGYYEDLHFRCCDCGKEEIWRAQQQQWWYEVAKGHVESTAKRCRPCRRRDQERRAQARQSQSDKYSAPE